MFAEDPMAAPKTKPGSGRGRRAPEIACALGLALIAGLSAGRGQQPPGQSGPAHRQVNLARLSIARVWAPGAHRAPFDGLQRAFDGPGEEIDGTRYSTWKLESPASCRWVYVTFDRPVTVHGIVLTLQGASSGGQLLLAAVVRTPAEPAWFGPIEIPFRAPESDANDFDLIVEAGAVSELAIVFVTRPPGKGYWHPLGGLSLDVSEIRILGVPPEDVERSPVIPAAGRPGPEGFACPVFDDTRTRFTAADTDRGMVQFDPPLEVDFEQLARERYGEVDLDAMRSASGDIDLGSTTYRAALERFRGQADTVLHRVDRRYDAPVPEPFRRRPPYLISADGVIALLPERLEGVVRFVFDDHHERILRVEHLGMVLGARADGLAGASGFVVRSTEPPVMVAMNEPDLADAVASARIDAERTLASGVPSGRSWTPQMEARARDHYRARSSYTFRVTGDPADYVFFEWVDESAPETECRRRLEITTRQAPLTTLEQRCADRDEAWDPTTTRARPDAR